MSTINFQNLGFIAQTPLFSDLNLVIADGDRVGLVAGNGGGKTTLFECIVGRSDPSAGEITRSRGAQIGYVEQSVADELLDMTLRDAVASALSADARENESWRVDIALDGFSTPEALRDRKVSALSGGWQRLMLIARIWVNDPDILLLDEPTNHLDLSKIMLLESWLNMHARNMPVIISSHDREFLDATTNRTLFLRPETSHYFSLPYSRARQSLGEVDEAAAKKQGKELKEADRLRKNAAKLKNIGINSGSDLLVKKTKQLTARADKIEENALSLHKDRYGEVKLSNSGTHAKVLIGLDEVEVKTPDGALLYKTGKVHIFQGDRIVLLGQNGAGKSQLVKQLHRAILTPETERDIKVTPSLALGHMDQELGVLSPYRTPEEAIGGFGLGDARARALLATAGFPVEKHKQPLSALSFGQRSRLVLLMLRLTEPNFYLMDEPTNHVDIPAQERLEEEILKHQASCVLVSHDRRFVRNIGTRFLLIKGKRLVEVDDPEAFFMSMADEEA